MRSKPTVKMPILKSCAVRAVTSGGGSGTFSPGDDVVFFFTPFFKKKKRNTEAHPCDVSNSFMLNEEVNAVKTKRTVTAEPRRKGG